MSRALARLAVPAPRERSLADSAYEQLKASIFDFELLPGDRFSETDIAERLKMSRTPVRDALYRLEREGYLRLILEIASVTRLCDAEERADLDALKATWLVPAADRLTEPMKVAALDEGFHMSLVEAAGNPEVARCHREVTERIRVVRRLDFTQAYRIDKTYEEHAQILRAIIRRRTDEAVRLLRTHIEASKAEVRKITLHRLYTARPSK